jgi:hypothetical protein
MASTQNAAAFAANMIAHVNQFINAFHDLGFDRDRLTEDPELAQAAADAMNAAGRTGLTATQFTNAGIVLDAMQQTWNGGNPSNKSCLYDLL